MGRENRSMYSALAAPVGALITVMSSVNSRFAGVAGNLAATLVIHAAGLVAVSALLLTRFPAKPPAKRDEARPGRIPVYFYLGGFIGVGTVFSINYAFAALGASLAVALALLGQTLFSVVVDATGFMGRARYPLSFRRLPGLALAVAGVAVMGAAGNGQVNLLAMPVGLAAGVLPGLTFILNSELGRRKGILRSTRINYVVGLATTFAIVLAVWSPAMAAAVVEAARAVLKAGPFLALGGGFMGVAVVAATSFIFPRMPALSATLLLFSGQALAGLLIDFVAEGAFDARKLASTSILLAGLTINALLSRLARKPEKLQKFSL